MAKVLTAKVGGEETMAAAPEGSSSSPPMSSIEPGIVRTMVEVAGTNSSRFPHLTFEEVATFMKLANEIGKVEKTQMQSSSRSWSKFLQKFSHSLPWHKALSLHARALVGQFTRLWPSPKTMEH